jgi:redox-sensitive bicupin YhaK (pirin superfamily)
LPAQGGLTPGYEQKPFDLTTGSLTQIAGVESGSASVKIHQDAKLYAGKLTASASLSYAIAAGRRVWVQLVSGELAIADKLMAAGDGAAVANELSLQLGAHDAAHFLLFDLA